jgi:hypothetical protein
VIYAKKVLAFQLKCFMKKELNQKRNIAVIAKTKCIHQENRAFASIAIRIFRVLFIGLK